MAVEHQRGPIGHKRYGVANWPQLGSRLGLPQHPWRRVNICGCDTIKALVDTGAELKVIPEEIAIKESLTTRNLNMNLQVLGRPYLADNNIRLELSHKQGEILSYKEPDGRRLCMPICKPQGLGWQNGPPRGMDLWNMEKLVRNTPGKKFQNAKGDNTIINLTQKTQYLSISSKRDKIGQCLQNQKWPNNLKRQIEESKSEDELPNIIYKQIDNNEEIFQNLVDGYEKRNGNAFKTKPKRKKVRFSDHELSDEEIINDIEKDFRIM
ncbi:hypothetical protein O181_123217 [Austropuccinia psidii MF-1]|uniref:Peptidase A2 domain-containing protein n=1 Tax=Austropuccinia psidii MF-1 TaxID=1389203 RepID=A0A9Q3KPM2_9BASI|nr:hypothetical protein [Austropuccinia psidii MF-1]